MVSTKWTRLVPPYTRPLGMEESDPGKCLAPSGAKPKGHDDDDDDEYIDMHVTR